MRRVHRGTISPEEHRLHCSEHIVNLLLIMFPCTYSDLLCQAISSSSARVSLMMWPRYFTLLFTGNTSSFKTKLGSCPGLSLVGYNYILYLPVYHNIDTIVCFVPLRPKFDLRTGQRPYV